MEKQQQKKKETKVKHDSGIRHVCADEAQADKGTIAAAHKRLRTCVGTNRF